MRESFVADAHFLMRYRFATLALVGAPRGARRGRKIADTTGLRLSARHPPFTLPENDSRREISACPFLSSCPDLIRASTIWTGRKKDVDGRDKPGHGEGPGEH
jgi:hypothetical protein